MSTYHEPTANDVTVYVGIGNSDDKVTQVGWRTFIDDIRSLARTYSTAFLGEWFSLPDARWQNAEFGWIMPVADVPGLRRDLRGLADAYEQDSIALAIVARTEFVGRDAR